MKLFCIYLIIINLVAVIITVHDKIAAKRHRRRVSELTLLLVSVLGGSPAMLLTMLIIRHKTRKPKFMVGIPVMLILQLAVTFLVLHYVVGLL